MDSGLGVYCTIVLSDFHISSAFNNFRVRGTCVMSNIYLCLLTKKYSYPDKSALYKQNKRQVGTILIVITSSPSTNCNRHKMQEKYVVNQNCLYFTCNTVKETHINNKTNVSNEREKFILEYTYVRTRWHTTVTHKE